MPVRTAQELIALLKAEPGRHNLATAGIGRLLARPVWLGAWAMLGVAALVAAGSHAGELRAYANLHLATPSMLLMMCGILLQTLAKIYLGRSFGVIASRSSARSSPANGRQ